MAASEGIMKTKDDCRENWCSGGGGEIETAERDEREPEVYSSYKYFRTS
jgi:hypothetical protein